MSASQKYTLGFYEQEATSSRALARRLVPFLDSLFASGRLGAIVDVGCGRGEVLAEFERRMHRRLALGIDGEWAAAETLAPLFVSWDLTRPVTWLGEFDLALCLEVAEHLPASAADTLVDTLVQAAPVVCFSAAVPGQGGTHHVNEQFPAFWQRKFAQRGFACYDLLRRVLLRDRSVPSEYAQSILLYARLGFLPQHRAVSGRVELRVRDDYLPRVGRIVDALPSGLREAAFPLYRKAVGFTVHRALGR